MAKRGFWDSFARGYAMGDRMVKDWDAASLNRDLSAAASEKVEELPQYASADEFDTGGYVTGKQYSFDGKTYDKPVTDTQLDGLRASKMARVYDKHGKTDQAMRLRSQSRQAKEEDRTMQMRDAVDAERKRYQEALKDPRKFGIEAYKANEGVGGVGDHKDRSIDFVDMPNGMMRVTQYDKDNNVLVYKDLKPEQFDQVAKDFLFKNHILNLSAIDGDKWAPLAYQMAKDDKHMQMLLNDRDYKRGRDKVSDEQWGKTYQAGREDAKDAKEYRNRSLSLQAAMRSDARIKEVPVYDLKTGEQTFVRIDPSKVNPGETIKPPPGFSFSKKVDSTDTVMDRLLKERKVIEDEFEFLSKNKRDGEYLSFGDKDPENQDNARLSVLRNRLSEINTQLTQMNVAPTLPARESAQAPDAQAPAAQVSQAQPEIKEERPSLGNARLSWSSVKGVSPSVLAMRMRELESKARESEDPEAYLAQNNYAAIKRQYDQMTAR